MSVLEAGLTGYLEALLPPRSAVLAKMEAEAERQGFPIVGPLVGRLLEQQVRLLKARRIFELGSGFGYSALWMALAMDPGGRIHCTEEDPDRIGRGRAYLEAAGVSERVVWHQGDALQELARSAAPFDLILNDAHKRQYPEVLAIAWPRLRRGGLLITDNVLWSGRVLAADPTDPDTAAIRSFNREAFLLRDAVSAIVPLRDGVMLTLKQ